VISRIRKHHAFIAHYHTAGVPGRAEIDDSQELNYARMMKGVLETGGTCRRPATERRPYRDKWFD
jgi:hydroxypyruvate isomerase